MSSSPFHQNKYMKSCLFPPGVGVRSCHSYGYVASSRLALVTGSMPQYLTSLQKQLQAHGGQYFADKRLTVADLNAFVDVRALNSVWLDHVPAELVQTVAPLQNAHLQRIAQDPAALAYCAKFAASQRGTGFTTVNLVPIGPVTVKADLLAC